MGSEKSEKSKNFEEVETTLDELREERRIRDERRSPAARFFRKLARPFSTAYGGIKRFFQKFRVPIAIKTTFTYTLLFTIVLIALDAFIVTSVARHLEAAGVADSGYIVMLSVTSAALILVSVAVVAALGSLVSSRMLSPIRRMLKRIDSISADDLTTRLDEVDAQDELKELTERINKMLDKLEASFERQKKFVSDASHELKTPIAVIRGYANLLMRWGKEDEAVLVEGLESISREADDMSRIVEQLLRLARVGQYMISPEEFDFGKELGSIVDAYRMVEKGRVFELDAPQGVVGRTDRSIFTECVRALVDNAVKYSGEGSRVRIALSRTENGAVVDVADEGVGISEEDLGRVFDRFYRCDRSRSRGQNSIGLGLTITKSLIELLGGEVLASSTPGKGSVFSLRFPLDVKNSAQGGQK